MIEVKVITGINKEYIIWLVENTKGNFHITSVPDVAANKDPEIFATFGSYVVIKFENDDEAKEFQHKLRGDLN